MTTTVALLRAKNVGGTGKLAMSDLRALCEKIGFIRPQTFGASGNIVFGSPLPPAGAKKVLEDALRELTGANARGFLRTEAELAEVLDANPFKHARGNLACVLFLDAPPGPDALAAATGRVDEVLALGAREIFLYYPKGMGPSKLKLPDFSTGTARNMNTVAKLFELCCAHAAG